MTIRPILHPKLRTAMPEHWPSLCTIQTITTTTSASNQPVPSGATDVAGLVDIQCSLAALFADRGTDNEIRTEKVLEQYERRRVKLNGYFPQIQPRSMQAVVDGVVYGIRGVESDSLSFSTRLNLEVLLPHG